MNNVTNNATHQNNEKLKLSCESAIEVIKKLNQLVETEDTRVRTAAKNLLEHSENTYLLLKLHLKGQI